MRGLSDYLKAVGQRDVSNSELGLEYYEQMLAGDELQEVGVVCELPPLEAKSRLARFLEGGRSSLFLIGFGKDKYFVQFADEDDGVFVHVSSPHGEYSGDLDRTEIEKANQLLAGFWNEMAKTEVVKRKIGLDLAMLETYTMRIFWITLVIWVIMSVVLFYIDAPAILDQGYWLPGSILGFGIVVGGVSSIQYREANMKWGRRLYGNLAVVIGVLRVVLGVGIWVVIAGDILATIGSMI